MKKLIRIVIIAILFIIIGFVSDTGDTAPETEENSFPEAGAVKLEGKKHKITIEGSTSVAVLMEILAEAYMENNKDVRIDIMANGTNAAIKAVSQGNADLGMVSRYLKNSEKTVVINEIQIAWDALAVIVNPQNPVIGLTKDQVIQMYQGSIKKWIEVGGADKWIHLISREEGSGTQEAFRELFEIHEIFPGAQTADGNGSVIAGVAGKINAIGYISLGFVQEQVKSIKIDGIVASRENTINGSYTLKRPYCLILRNEVCDDSIKELITFILSEEGQGIVSQKYIPVKLRLNSLMVKYIIG